MHSRLFSCFLFIGLLCFSALGAHGQTMPVARAPGIIKVALVSGSVTALRGGVAITLSKGANVLMGDTVQTADKSTVVLSFSNGSNITLAANSILDVTKYLQTPLTKQIEPANLKEEPEGTTSETELDLRRGELVGSVKKLNKNAADPSAYTVRTPVGAAGIRGTIFRVVYRPSNDGKAFFSVTTAEGRVEVFGGVVSAPSFVGLNEEVEITVDIDTTTGALLSPPVIVTPTTAPPQTLTAISNAVVAAVESLKDVIIAAGNTEGTAAPSSPTEETTTAGTNPVPSNTTNGDGKS